MGIDVNTTFAEAALDALADPVVVSGTDGLLAYVNAAASLLLGEPAEALRGRPADSIVPARLREVEGMPFFEWLVRRYVEGGRPVRVPVLRSDGVEIHQCVRVSTTTVEGEGVAVVAVLQTPADRIEADPLRLDTETPTPERSYKALFDSVPVGALRFDARGRVTDCNDVCVAQMGGTRAQMIGLDMLTLPNAGVAEAVREALAGRDGRYQGEYRSVTGKRASLYRAIFSPIVRDGRVEGGVGIIEDITERRTIEARLAQGERMASLGRLAAGVAHEINNPLAYVRTSLDIARRELERLGAPEGTGGQQLRDAIDRAEDGIERVRVIASDLKTFSRGDEGAWIPVDLREVAETAINLVHTEIRHRAELVREVAPVPPVMGSETRYVQVLVNLLLNAVQALPEDDGEDHRIVVRIGEVRPGRVFVEVEDDGSGIDPDLAAHVFEPFWTSKPMGVGTGLGLSICHGIVASVGGEIRVARTAPGKGTTFRIELKATDPVAYAKEQAARRRPPRPTPSRRLRVLVVDDEAQLGTSLRVALTERYDVTVSGSGADALARIERGPKFDLVLCDVMMPEMSGMDLFEATETVAPEQARRFVFMTGGAFTERARSFLARTRIPRLQKPFGLEEVELLIDRDLR